VLVAGFDRLEAYPTARYFRGAKGDYP
jgi:hypothetical protein